MGKVVAVVERGAADVVDFVGVVDERVRQARQEGRRRLTVSVSAFWSVLWRTENSGAPKR